MALSNDLISQFVKVTQNDKQTTKESTAYGKIVKQGDVEYVQLDGSDLLTPITSTTVVNDGDRVMVTIKNHTAIVTGDFTNPSANDKEVKEIGGKISEFEIIIADKVSVGQLEAEVAKIDKLIADNIEATNAKFETIEGKVAEIDTIKADVVEVEKKITAHEGEFTTIRGEIAEFEDVTAKEVDAIEGSFHTLESDYANFKETTTNKITANEGSIAELETKKLDTESAKIIYANIDFSNIKEAAIEKLFTDSGIIKDLIMKDGNVTGELVGVTIKGDLIEGNTVKADKLVILGEDGIYYKLNVDALGETTASSDEKYQNGLDGSVIIAKSITADRVAVTDLVAFGATIGGYHITDHSLYSGVKNSVSNTTRGVFLGDDGQMAIGDANNYLKFFKDTSGNYKLEIQASAIKFGTSGSTVEEIIDEAVGNIEIGGRNLLPDTDFNGESMLRTEPEDGTGEGGFHFVPVEQIESGIEYTLSARVRGTADVVFYEINEGGNVNHHWIKKADLSDTVYQNYTITFTVATNRTFVDAYICTKYGTTAAGEWFEIEPNSLKLEKGNKATDWTPAPEDINSDILGAQTTANDANTTANNANAAASEARASIELLQNMIANLVTDGNGGSLMTQTDKGWTFNMSNITGNLEAIQSAIENMNTDHSETYGALEKLTSLVNDVANKTAYIVIGKDDNEDPCIILGKTDNDFKVRITNTAIDFMEGSTKIAYANNNTFYAEKMIVKNELQIGAGPGFVWRTRANGNMGLVYISG